jgi:hypothetical protein
MIRILPQKARDSSYLRDCPTRISICFQSRELNGRPNTAIQVNDVHVHDAGYAVAVPGHGARHIGEVCKLVVALFGSSICIGAFWCENAS